MAKKVLKTPKIAKKIFGQKNKYVFKKFDCLRLSNYELAGDQNKSVPVNKVIWTGWLQGEKHLPEVTNYCLKSIRAHSNNHPVILITLNNLKKYLPNFPDFILEKYTDRKMLSAHLMDIIRIMLIRRYGGIWIDPTVLVTRDFSNKSFNLCFYSYRGNPSPWGSNPSESKWCTFLMGGKKDSTFYKRIEIGLLSYWKSSDVTIDYFLLDYLMKWIYLNDSEIQINVDSIKQSKGTVFDLVDVLGNKYSEKEFTKYEQLLNEEPIYKLTYKRENMLNEDSLFTYLLRNSD